MLIATSNNHRKYIERVYSAIYCLLLISLTVFECMLANSLKSFAADVMSHRVAEGEQDPIIEHPGPRLSCQLDGSRHQECLERTSIGGCGKLWKLHKSDKRNRARKAFTGFKGFRVVGDNG
jgi:hypothetical protein